MKTVNTPPPSVHARSWTRLALHDTEDYVQHDEGIGHVHAHVKGLPHRGCEVVQPEVVARGGHQKQDDERDQTEWLEWDLTDRRVPSVADEHADERVECPGRVELDDREHPVRQREREHHHAEMATVVEKREEIGGPIAPAGRYRE